MANNIATQIASLYAAIGADLSGLNSGLKSAQSTLHNAGASLARTGTIMSAAITAPLLALGKKMVGVASSFESQMNVMTLAASRDGASMETLRSAAVAVGNDIRLVGIDAAEAAGAMTNFYKAGLNTSQIMGDMNAYLNDGAELGGALRAAVDLATASELDLAQASDVVAVAMATFGLDASEASRITDGFVRAADSSLSSVGTLAEALGNFGPTAAAFGWSLEDTNAALAILSNSGIQGAEAGTNLKSMMTNLMRPTDKVTKMLKKLNVTLYDEEGATRSLPDIIGQLAEATKDMTDEQKNNTITTLAGTYGMKAMQVLLKSGTEGWEDMVGMISTASTTQVAAAARTKGFAAAMENLQGVIQTFMITVGTPLIQNFLTPLVQRVTGVIGSISELDPKILNLGLAFAGAAAVAGPMLLLLGGAATLLGGLLSPVGLAAGALLILAAKFVKAQGGIEGATKALTDWYNGLEDKSVGGIGKTLLDELVATAKEIPYRLLGWALEVVVWAKSDTTKKIIANAGASAGETIGKALRDLLTSDKEKDATKNSLVDMISSALTRAITALDEQLANFGRELGAGIGRGLGDFDFGAWFIESLKKWIANEDNRRDAIRRLFTGGDADQPDYGPGGKYEGPALPAYGPATPPGYASGTASASGGWSLVGERGPELVNLPRGSQVLDANETKAAMGTTVNIAEGAIVIHVNNGNAREVQRGVVGALRQIGMPA